MASIVIGAAISAGTGALGGAIGGELTGIGLPFGSFIGRSIGHLAAGYINDAIFGIPNHNRGQDTHLTDLALQTSNYGRMIPIVYGQVRIAGNMIWAQPIQQSTTTTTNSRGGKGGVSAPKSTTTTYSYSISLAIAICEGPVDAVLRVWADSGLLDLSQYTLSLYLGDEDQAPDAFMQSIDGADSTPAYRGLAYVVFHDFPLAAYGNRIPNFTFEVQKKAQHADYGGQTLEEMIGGVIMIPGAGEFVYDTAVETKVPGSAAGATFAQSGASTAINMNNAYGKADVLVALDQLQGTCPNVSWVGVVVTWFGTSMDISTCEIVPGVEYQTVATTQPNVWSVAGFTRDTAHQIASDGDAVRYGGTPDDASVLRLLAELRGRGYKIMFYPMLFMDVAGKPWRGELTGAAADISGFFTGTNGYNAFISHYAGLVAGAVDAFIIGSEMKGLTAVTDTPGGYPAVDAFVSLAATVKSALGSGVTVTYAADWSEYHHTDGGYYNLDPLWASSDIDVVGIDAYFPLTTGPQDTTYNIQTIIDGWTSGEGYDFYYTDPGRTITAPLDPPYAWKNIGWWWGNAHINPDATTTAWVPESKPVWFTEFGYPSVDCAGNEPNVFYDPATSASAFPYFSKGRVDFRAQRAALTAAEAQWGGSSMVQNMFVWTWDARPYPYFPDLLDVWADGGDWAYGHWVGGKLGVSSLAAIVQDLCERAGLADADIDVSAITNQVSGYVITGQQTIRASIENLQQGYFFDASESDYILKFIPRGGISAQAVPEDDIVLPPGKKQAQTQTLISTRKQEIELPKRINMIYLSRLSNYQSATQYAQREVTVSRNVMAINLPIVFDDQSAKNIADVALYTEWVGRNTYRVYLPIKYAQLEPADVITVTSGGVAHTMRITATSLAAPGVLRIDAQADDVSAYDFYTPPGYAPTGTAQTQPVAATLLEFLDIAALPGDAVDAGALRFAASGAGANWNGAAIYRSDDAGGTYNLLLALPTASVMGTALTALPGGPTAVFDMASSVNVSLIGGELASAATLSVLNGANVALVGNEIIQFATATLTTPGNYTLSGLLRGRQGTEWAIGTHAIGEAFVLLDGLPGKQPMPNSLINLLRPYKPVTAGASITATAEDDFTYTGVGLKPYAPVQVAGVRDGSGNLTISWVRRARVSGEWQDYVDVPLNEAAEAYEVDILSGSVTVRTITGLSAPSASYGAADQTADFGSAQSSVSVKVYQLSEAVGRGYAAAASV